LRIVLRDLGQHTDKVAGRLGDHSVQINWWAEEPEEIEPEEQRVIDLLKEYDASLRAWTLTIEQRQRGMCGATGVGARLRRDAL
jgi:hypothetical protein